MKPIVLTGLTATGNLTLGNYIGSILPLKNLQDNHHQDYDIFIFVADLHALTISIEKEEFENNIDNIFKIYLASGINPKIVKIFRQSEVIGHTELFYYLLINTNVGQLNRMTQYKDKIVQYKNKTEFIPTGILLYPVLMAADILLYNTSFVPVGKDQKQHIEFTRDLTEKINKRYNLSFNIPEPLIADNVKGGKIMSLKDPSKKMSKTDDDKDATIFLLDTEKDIERKISKAITDSENKVYYDVVNKPGVSNLLVIYSILSNKTIEDIEKKFEKYDYKKFKNEVAKLIWNTLKNIQTKFEIINDNDIKEMLLSNVNDVQNIANENLLKIEKAMGIKK